MKSLETLKRESAKSTKSRGHKMGAWQYYGKSAGRICKICGLFVDVNYSPAPNEINICGEVVALNCKRGGK